MTKACFCGTFDPLTRGHLDVIQRASRLFDQVYVFICVNSEKKEAFSKEKRLDWLEKETRNMGNVICQTHEGLTIDACHKVGSSILIRGIRNILDFEYEKNIEAMNRKIDPSIDTVYLITDPEYAHCSSSNVRELLKYGQDISSLVPECVARDLKRCENE